MPRFDGNLSIFAGELRDLLFSSQESAAAYFHLHRSRISRYENVQTNDRPPLGYLAGLARLLAERAQNALDVQQALLREVNRVISSRIYRRGRFRAWGDLCRAADDYLDKRRKSRQAAAPTAHGADHPAPGAGPAELERRLEPPTYHHLIGVASHLDNLLHVLTGPGPPWLVAIEGLGGLGKTSLADAVSRQAIRQQLFDDFGWVSARQYDFNPGLGVDLLPRPALTVDVLVEKLVEQLMADVAGPGMFSGLEGLATLQARLKQHRHLIVIDNLESVLDLRTLLPTLIGWSNPTKFLLTSRQSLHHEFGIYHFPLPELKRADALRLIRYEARLHNSYLIEVGDEELGQIYNIVGGNPLAIRLIVGQAHVFSLDVILDDLTKARGQTVESLYTFIYRQAWDRLDERTRKVLLALPLIADGQGSLEHLADLCGVDAAGLRDALALLVTLNLVNRYGDPSDPHYYLHSLTRTFLHTQVLKWL